MLEVALGRQALPRRCAERWPGS